MPEPKKSRSEIRLLPAPYNPCMVPTSVESRVPAAADLASSDQREKPMGSGSDAEGDEKRSCAHCQTTKTPLWRGGPTGPKSLCNACGIKYRKRVREGGTLGFAQKKATASPRVEESGRSERSSKVKMVGVVEMVLEKQRRQLMVVQKKRCQRRNGGSGARPCMGEEEEAAIMLMALASGLCHGL